MGFKNKKIIRNEEFKPLELTNGNVQAIFNRCLATSNSKDVVSALIASSLTGFDKSSIKIISFDKTNLLANRPSIEYLYGQLKSIHTPVKRLPISDLFVSYSGEVWTSNKDILMELLYLGSSKDSRILDIFEAQNMTTSFVAPIKPTLSPKDPNFQAWWAQHKSEWETPKKDGHEPADM